MRPNRKKQLNPGIEYDFQDIEKKWQESWVHNHKGTDSSMAQKNKPKYYVLEMFPYPSGNIHMGHLRNYTIGDVVAKYKKFSNYNVFHPMGWDAFGLPAENAAIEHQVHPKDWTYKNIANMKQQLKAIGLSYNWEQEICTCSPEYFGAEQSIFIDFFKKDLAYQKESFVNWDPVDKTVLANEQVVDGKGWRSGASVEKKKLKQWFLKITQYSEELLDGLNDLTGWPSAVKAMQEKWIGRSKGLKIHFRINETSELLEIFTTRPETIFGAAFCAISPEHPFAEKLALNSKEVRNFIEKCNKISTAEVDLSLIQKEGIDTKLTCVHPLDPKKTIPLYIANFVLMEYGTGAVFGCPAHDQRDFDFASKYNLPIVPVIQSPNQINEQLNNLTKAYEDSADTDILINSNILNGLNVLDAKEKIIEILTKDIRIADLVTNYRLRDWGVSRQRYWGCPIPIVHCKNCGAVPVKKEDLPLELPDDIAFNDMGNPLDTHPDWKYTICPLCEQSAIRETDTLDTFFESSWYFLRYVSAHRADLPFSKELVNELMPVDQYIGGIEHATMHLLYARFFMLALRDCGFTDITHPFVNLLTQGMVCHKTYKTINTNNWVDPENIEDVGGLLIDKLSREEVIVGRSEKMSKSKKNGISPDKIINLYGADTARLFVLSDSPPEKNLEWSAQGVEGCFKFLNKLHSLIYDFKQHYDLLKIRKYDIDHKIIHDECLQLFKFTQKTIFYIKQDYDNLHFNKVIARIRELYNNIYSLYNGTIFEQEDKEIYIIANSRILYESLQVLIQLLFPITPHICEELWESLFFTPSLSKLNSFPQYDPKFIVDDQVTIAVQIMGKLRATVQIRANATQQEIENIVLEIDNVKKYLQDKVIKRIIYIPKKIMNIVT